MKTYQEIISQDEISMYVCGPTVYDYLHIGNIRPIIVFDTYRKGLEYIGKKVNYVSNITDIDDKIIDRAEREGTTTTEIANSYTQKYLELLEQLHVGETKIVKVTELINEMTEFIDVLIKDGYAYQTADGIYLDVTKYEHYGAVSKKDIDNLRTGIRIEKGDKKSELDFVLWKFDSSDNSFNSKLGKGRPGWHTECVVIINEAIGEQVDIHCGGQDLAFPHHENENIQNIYYTGKPLAKLWLHNGFVNINNEKMSKSLGNTINGQELIDQYGTNLVRWVYLSTSYTKPINISNEIFENEMKIFDRIRSAYYLYLKLEKINEKVTKNHEIVNTIKEIVKDDNSSVKLEQIVLDFAKIANSKIENDDLIEVGNAITDVLEILGIKFDDIYNQKNLDIIAEYDNYRENNEYEKADELREETLKNGLELRTTRKGTIIVPVV